MKLRSASGGMLVLAMQVFLLSCGPVELVTVNLKKGPDHCEDDVTPVQVTVAQGKREMVVWRIHNLCGAPETLRFSLKDGKPVTDCGISPPKPNFTTIDTEFTVADGEVTNLYCTHAEGANDKDYKYKISIKGSGMSTLSHELDIGTNP